MFSFFGVFMLIAANTAQAGPKPYGYVQIWLMLNEDAGSAGEVRNPNENVGGRNGFGYQFDTVGINYFLTKMFKFQLNYKTNDYDPDAPSKSDDILYANFQIKPAGSLPGRLDLEITVKKMIYKKWFCVYHNLKVYRGNA